MQITEILFEPATFTVISGIGAAVSVGRSIIVFQRSTGELGKSLRKLERRFDRLSEGLPETRERVALLETRVEPLRAKLRTINLYFDRINEIWTAAEMKDAREEEKKEPEPGRRNIDAPESGKRPGGKA